VKIWGYKAGVQCSALSRFEENKFPPQVFSSEFPGISDGDKKKPLLTSNWSLHTPRTEPRASLFIAKLRWIRNKSLGPRYIPMRKGVRIGGGICCNCIILLLKGE
jgi:hypothetical protein